MISKICLNSKNHDSTAKKKKKRFGDFTDGRREPGNLIFQKTSVKEKEKPSANIGWGPRLCV